MAVAASTCRPWRRSGPMAGRGCAPWSCAPPTRRGDAPVPLRPPLRQGRRDPGRPRLRPRRLRRGREDPDPRRGRAALHTDDALAEAAWTGSRAMSRVCYGAEPGPGTSLPAGDAYSLPDETAAATLGRPHFAAVLVRAERLDFLYLDRRGHRRAAWHAAGGWSGGWIAPYRPVGRAVRVRGPPRPASGLGPPMAALHRPACRDRAVRAKARGPGRPSGSTGRTPWASSTRSPPI